MLSFIDKNYIDKVECFRINDKHFQAMQTFFYNEFYQKYKSTFEWCLFCDIDEFLVGLKNIKAVKMDDEEMKGFLKFLEEIDKEENEKNEK